MRNFLKYFFCLEKNPKKGLMAYEWIVLAYLIGTLIMVVVMRSQLPNADSMIWGRARIFAITLALWGVYRMLPCGLTRTVRAVVHMSLLSWWYPDIFELNRLFPNLDHLFASWEQTLFGCQPALLFSEVMNSAVFSEMMCMGYWSYYPLMAVVSVGVLLTRKAAFDRVVTIILGTFFVHYVIFILLPVGGPQFYYEAVGMDKIAEGIFPNLHDHFNHQQVRMACPGYTNGFFYDLVEQAHQAGERPIAAFPSSHVSVCMVLMLAAWFFHLRKLFWILMPFAFLLCLSTVYIRAHYAIDALAGIVSGTLCWLIFYPITRRMELQSKPVKKKKR